jgi:hypothetical protein
MINIYVPEEDQEAKVAASRPNIEESPSPTIQKIEEEKPA